MNCDFKCENEATVDGKTIYGPWANMCEAHFIEVGVGLGTGRGQKLNVGPISLAVGPDVGTKGALIGNLSHHTGEAGNEAYIWRIYWMRRIADMIIESE